MDLNKLSIKVAFVEDDIEVIEDDIKILENNVEYNKKNIAAIDFDNKVLIKKIISLESENDNIIGKLNNFEKSILDINYAIKSLNIKLQKLIDKNELSG